MNTGEIKLNTEMGKFLYNLAKNQNYFQYVETGTKYGNGSTYCIVKGLLERNDNSKLTTYETKKEFYLIAIDNNKNISSDKLVIKNKTLVTYDELPPHKTWNNNDKETYHYNIDLKQCECESFIEKIDVLILDSGGWSRYAEWSKYKDNIKVIVIDDTKVSTNKIREEIINSGKWKILRDELNDRAGWLAAEII